MKRIKALFIIWLILSGAIYVLGGSKAAAAMFIVALFYCVLAAVFVYGSGRKLRVSIKGGRSIDKNKKAELTVDTKSDSIMPVPSARFLLSCENVLTKEKQNIPMAYSFGPKGKNHGGLSVTNVFCGRENVSVRDAVIQDPIGLFSRRQKIEEEAACYVMPQIKEIVIPSEYLDSYDMESYSYSQYKKGNDTGEVFGIREYADGDSPKQIHWKLSAKLDDMMVKIPSFPIENKLVVLLDNSIPEGYQLSPVRRDALVEMLFSLSHSLLKKNITHSLGWCDHETGSFIVRRIENDGDMWSVVPEVLSAGIEESRITTAYRFLEASGEEHFTNHFVVTATGAQETERLQEYGEVRVFMSEVKEELDSKSKQSEKSKGKDGGKNR